MLNIFTVSFFGHRFVDNLFYAEKIIEDLVRDLIREKQYVEFLVGRNGDFDILVASCISRVKKELFDANSSLVWVQPYPKADYLKNPKEYEKYYDEIEIFSSVNVYPKAVFKARNKSMIDRSNLVVFWVKNNYGGAYEALKYAKKTGVKHINIYQSEYEL